MIFHHSLITSFISIVILTIYYSYSQTTTEYLPSDPRLPSIFKINKKSNISKSNSRSKRFLIFQNGGVLKLVFGFSEPLDLLDKHPYRQLMVSYSFHIQYTPPLVPVYWWTYFVNNAAWEHARSEGSRRRSKRVPVLHSNESNKHNYHYNPHLNHYGTFVQRHYRQPAIVYDVSRSVVYKAIETVFNSKGLPGERCLLRTICEISQRPLYEDNTIHGIINAVFSPSVPNIEEKYLHAKKIGDRGMDCEKFYWSCKEGIKWLQQKFYYM